jgi:hypothetical protein
MATPSNISDLISRTGPPIPTPVRIAAPAPPPPEVSFTDRMMQYVSEHRWIVGGIVLLLVFVFLYWLYLRNIFGASP